jgi:sigma-B regulation protein RsbU (phosphoserine phosphatase)
VSLRYQLIGIILGTVFVFIGLVACGTALIRSGGRVRLLLAWQGIFSSIYGGRIILQQEPIVLSVLPQSIWPFRVHTIWIASYLLIIPAILFWLELSRGKLRRLLQITLVAGVVVAVAGTWSTLISGSPDKFMPHNKLLGIWLLLLIATVNVVPSLAKRFLDIQSRIAAIAVLLFAAAALRNNLQDFLHLTPHAAFEPLAFGVLILALGYVAVERVFADERRLLSIQNELDIARKIQTSILPSDSPEIENLQIAAAYRPMTDVAGDFYEFMPIDQHRVGVLVADVSGHGVPAALIAAMIKAAMQSLAACACAPQEVLRGLNRILSGQSHDQFVTAAYLFIDTQNHKALYSAAGHPPLLLSRAGRLQRIESNGMVLGLMPESDYPVCELTINAGDRFALYTDGVIEPENANGDSFGAYKLEQVVLKHQSLPPSELLNQLLSEIQRWQPPSTTQQDDITLVVIDVT